MFLSGCPKGNSSRLYSITSGKFLQRYSKVQGCQKTFTTGRIVRKMGFARHPSVMLTLEDWSISNIFFWTVYILCTVPWPALRAQPIPGDNPPRNCQSFPRWLAREPDFIALWINVSMPLPSQHLRCSIATNFYLPTIVCADFSAGLNDYVLCMFRQKILCKEMLPCVKMS